MAAQIAAVYSVCTSVDQFDGEQIAFPNATIVHGTFKTSLKAAYKPSSPYYARVTIKGHFVSGGRLTGTITSATNVTASGPGPGPPCVTTNPWSAKVKRRGFGACNPSGSTTRR